MYTHVPDSLIPSHVLVMVLGFERVVDIAKEINDTTGNNTVFNILHSTVTS